MCPRLNINDVALSYNENVVFSPFPPLVLKLYVVATG